MYAQYGQCSRGGHDMKVTETQTIKLQATNHSNWKIKTSYLVQIVETQKIIGKVSSSSGHWTASFRGEYLAMFLTRKDAIAFLLSSWNKKHEVK